MKGIGTVPHRQRLAFLIACCFLPARVASTQQSLLPGDLYEVDQAHSTFDFTARLVGFNRVRMTFAEYYGSFLVVPADLTRSSVSVTVKAGSLQTGVGERDLSVKSAEFLDVPHFPRITFRSRHIDRSVSGFTATGDLTIKGVTREVVIPFTVTPPATDQFGNMRLAVAGNLTIDRRDFGVNGPNFWSHAISDSLSIDIDVGIRRWDWSELGWASGPKRSIGEMLVTEAGRGNLNASLAKAARSATASDTTYNFSLWEFRKAAGRLVQLRRPADAAAILELGLQVNQQSDSTSRAAGYSQLAEVYAIAGNRARAIAAAQQAQQIDAGDTESTEIIRSLAK